MAPNFLKPGDSKEQATSAREREVRHMHEAAESSWPPPSASSKIPSYVKQIKNHADVWDSVRKIAVSVVAIGGIVIGAFTYVVKIIIRSEIDDFKARIDPAALVHPVKAGEVAPPTLDEKLNNISTSVARIDQKVADQSDAENQRWNKLDKILEKNFGDSTSPKPPAFGPKAKEQGR